VCRIISSQTPYTLSLPVSVWLTVTRALTVASPAPLGNGSLMEWLCKDRGTLFSSFYAVCVNHQWPQDIYK
jgi:hypothetical protein